MKLPVDLHFVGVLPSEAAESIAHGWFGLLERLHPAVRSWRGWIERPQAPNPTGGYAVRVQARLTDGALVATCAHGTELLATVREAFEGIEQLLDEAALQAAPSLAWRARAAAALAAGAR